MKNKKRSDRRRSIIKDRFNKPIEKSNFLNIFQEVLMEKMILAKQGKCSQKNLDRAIRKYSKRKPSDMNLSTKEWLLLTCTVDPNLYLRIQETAKRLFGEYIPMDSLIHELLSWFVYYYMSDTKRRKVGKPYVEVNKKRKGKVVLFEKRFKKYYKNTL